MDLEEEEEIIVLPETQIKQYIKEIEQNESQYLATTLKKIYETNVI